MAIKTGRVLKSNDVKIEGRFQLNAERARRDLSGQSDITSATPEVYVVEQHPEYAVIEITCTCGRKTCVRCEYA